MEKGLCIRPRDDAEGVLQDIHWAWAEFGYFPTYTLGNLYAAMLFEGVDNALKLVGDPYLARVYQRACQRLHHGDWDASIFRKLSALESIHDKLANQLSDRRIEFLEIIIILLIAVEILMGLAA